MDFYVLKKQQTLIAIPADSQNCKRYINSGYMYIDKVAACDESNALKVLHEKQTKKLKWPVILIMLFIVIILTVWLF